MEGVVELPGDKSISHRYAILAALAEGAERNLELRQRGRLPQHARLPRASRNQNRIEATARARPRTRHCWTHRAAPHARRRKFRHDDAAAHRRACRPIVSLDDYGRFVSAPAADAADSRSSCGDGREDRRKRWRRRASRNSRCPIARVRLHAAGCERAGKIRNLACRPFRGRSDDGSGSNAYARSPGDCLARVWRRCHRREWSRWCVAASPASGPRCHRSWRSFLCGVFHCCVSRNARIAGGDSQRRIESNALPHSRRSNFNGRTDSYRVVADARWRIGRRSLGHARQFVGRRNLGPASGGADRRIADARGARAHSPSRESRFATRKSCA